MGLLTPGIGLLFWMFLTFLVLLFILGKFGWPVVLRMMKNRRKHQTIVGGCRQSKAGNAATSM